MLEYRVFTRCRGSLWQVWLRQDTEHACRGGVWWQELYALSLKKLCVREGCTNVEKMGSGYGKNINGKECRQW